MSIQSNGKGSSAAGLASRESSKWTPVGTPALGKQPARKWRILVVDDNVDAGDTLALLLKLKGHDVTIARDGVQAIEKVNEHRPEVILMDVGMPNLNGYDATRRIRETPHGRDALIVAVTGWSEASDIARSTEAGCSAHLVKPVDIMAVEKFLAQAEIAK